MLKWSVAAAFSMSISIAHAASFECSFKKDSVVLDNSCVVNTENGHADTCQYRFPDDTSNKNLSSNITGYCLVAKISEKTWIDCGFSNFYKPDSLIKSLRKRMVIQSKPNAGASDTQENSGADAGVLANGWSTSTSPEDFDQYYTTGASDPIIEVSCQVKK